MKVYQGLAQLPIFKNPVLTIGTFDGVHLGHRIILDRLLKKAQEVNGETVIITFEPHPRLVLGSEKENVKLLTTLHEKIDCLKTIGIHHLVVVPFTQEFAMQSAADYIEKFLVNHFHPHTFIIGYDHHFGKNRTGNFELLNTVKNQFRFQLEEIPAQEIEQIAVSSTKIREALLHGNMAKANTYLCRNYSFEGTVVNGDKRGRTLGFPTANIQLTDAHKLIPAKGVYVVKSWIENEIVFGMMNIGNRPTIENTSHISVEVHFFHFSKDIYNALLKIELLAYLREEKKFNSLDELVKQLHMDKENSLQFISTS